MSDTPVDTTDDAASTPESQDEPSSDADLPEDETIQEDTSTVPISTDDASIDTSVDTND